MIRDVRQFDVSAQFDCHACKTRIKYAQTIFSGEGDVYHRFITRIRHDGWGHTAKGHVCRECADKETEQ